MYIRFSSCHRAGTVDAIIGPGLRRTVARKALHGTLDSLAPDPRLDFDECALSVFNTFTGFGFCIADPMPARTPDDDWLRLQAGEERAWTVITQDMMHHREILPWNAGTH